MSVHMNETALGLLKIPDSDMSTCTPSGSETEDVDQEQRDRNVETGHHDHANGEDHDGDGRRSGGSSSIPPPLEPIRIRNLEDLFNSILY